MAERRMFAKSIITTDDFLDMPMSTRCLYFSLGMFADDDGFVSSPKSIMRQIGATQDDLKILVEKSYLLVFDSGVIVIKHWRIHNYIRSDRYKATMYQDEKASLTVTKDGAYVRNVETPTEATVGIPKDTLSVDERDTQVRLGKDKKEKEINKERERKFRPPTLEEVRAYCKERNNSINAEAFIDFYESKGWFVGKNKMKDWKAAVRNWERNEAGRNRQNASNAIQPKRYKEFETEDYERPDFERASMPSDIRNKLSGMFGGV